MNHDFFPFLESLDAWFASHFNWLHLKIKAVNLPTIYRLPHSDIKFYPTTSVVQVHNPGQIYNLQSTQLQLRANDYYGSTSCPSELERPACVQVFLWNQPMKICQPDNWANEGNAQVVNVYTNLSK